MSVADELRRVAEEQNRSADLPDTLLAELCSLADTPVLMTFDSEVRQLITLLQNFDLYAGAGCFSEASNVQDIEQAITRLRQKQEA